MATLKIINTSSYWQGFQRHHLKSIMAINMDNVLAIEIEFAGGNTYDVVAYSVNDHKFDMGNFPTRKRAERFIKQIAEGK
jgi:hypothetical protein|tara:strand:- start:161 stop:400 length:240 start_codon:yes stop_codon:yes gene_type:complete